MNDIVFLRLNLHVVKIPIAGMRYGSVNSVGEVYEAKHRSEINTVYCVETLGNDKSRNIST